MMKRKVLIIDDETDFCFLMKNYLSRKGYEVSQAGSLREGFEKLQSEKPDILFLDNNLPDGNGWDSIDRIVEIIPQVRAFLVSAHRNRSAYSGNVDKNLVIWEKPISLQVLNEAL